MNPKQTDSLPTNWYFSVGRRSPVAALPLFVLFLAAACGARDQELPVLEDSSMADTTRVAESVDDSLPDIVTEAVSEELDTAGFAVVLDSLRFQLARMETQIEQLQPAAPVTLVEPPSAQIGEQAVQPEGLDAGRRVQEAAQDVRNFTLRAIWAAIILLAAVFLIQGAVWLLGTGFDSKTLNTM